MTADPDPPLDPGQRPSSVAGDLEAIFAGAAPLAGPGGAPSKVRAMTARGRRFPIAAVGAVAAAGLVGLIAGTAMIGARGRPAATPPAAAAAAQRGLAVQVAAASPTVTLPAANGPIPVLDNEPVADTPSARAPGQPHVRDVAQHRHATPGDLMAADRRLRVAYSHAVQAGVPRHVLASYLDRWDDLRQDASWRPDRVAAGYGQMSADLERLARRSHGRRPPPERFSLFRLFS